MLISWRITMSQWLEYKRPDRKKSGVFQAGDYWCATSSADQNRNFGCMLMVARRACWHNDVHAKAIVDKSNVIPLEQWPRHLLVRVLTGIMSTLYYVGHGPYSAQEEETKAHWKHSFLVLTSVECVESVLYWP